MAQYASAGQVARLLLLEMALTAAGAPSANLAVFHAGCGATLNPPF